MLKKCKLKKEILKKYSKNGSLTIVGNPEPEKSKRK